VAITPLSSQFPTRVQDSALVPPVPRPTPAPLCPLCVRQLRLQGGGYIQTVAPRVGPSWEAGGGAGAQGRQARAADSCLSGHPPLPPPPPSPAANAARPGHSHHLAAELKCTPTLRPCRRAPAPHPRTQESSPFWRQTWTRGQVGPRGSGGTRSSRDVKHTSDLRNVIFTPSTRNQHGAMYRLGRTDRHTHGHGHTRTHLLGGPQGDRTPSWERMPTHSIHVSSMRPLHRIFIEPVQKRLWGGGRQARVPGGCLGVGVGLETWKKRDLFPLPICRACPPSPGVWITG